MRRRNKGGGSTRLCRANPCSMGVKLEAVLGGKKRRTSSMGRLRVTTLLDSMLGRSVQISKTSPQDEAFLHTPQAFTKPNVAKVQHTAYDDISTILREKCTSSHPIRLPKLSAHHPGTRPHSMRRFLGHLHLLSSLFPHPFAWDVNRRVLHKPFRLKLGNKSPLVLAPAGGWEEWPVGGTWRSESQGMILRLTEGINHKLIIRDADSEIRSSVRGVAVLKACATMSD